MSQHPPQANESFRWRAWLMAILVMAIIGLLLLLGLLWFLLFFLPGGGAITQEPTPTPQITRTAPATELPPSELPTPVRVEVNPATRTDTTLGQLTVNRPLRMSPNSSDSFFVSVRVPEQLASTVPIDIEIITIPADAPPVIGARDQDIVPLFITARMRVEIVAPAFRVTSTDPPAQSVRVDSINEPTFWTWSLIAPPDPGLHDITLKIFQLHPDRPESLAVPPRIYKIEVLPLTPTPAPVTTPTPGAEPFWQTPLGTTLISGLFVIAAALVGLVGIYLGRERLPIMFGSKSARQRRLHRLYDNLAYLQEQAATYGPHDVPLKLHNDIEALQEAIARLEAELKSNR